MHPQQIEIIGPPGAGKSTIYAALCKTWTANAPWIYQEALLTPAPPVSAFREWVAYRLKKITGRPTAKSIPVAYGLRFVQQHPELAAFCWQHLSDPSVYGEAEIDKRFRAAYFLYADFCRYQALAERGSGKPCVLSEGLLQKSFLIHDDAQRMADTVAEYLPLLPRPHAVIVVDIADKNVIVNRLARRAKVIASHLEKDPPALLADVEKWQYLLGLISGTLQTMGVPLYPVDGEKPVAETVHLLNQFLNSRKV